MEPDEFAGFYATHKDAVLRAVLVASGHHPGAEDAVAEAFTRAWRGWETVRVHPNPTAWVLRTALNVQRSWWRRIIREASGTPPDRAAVPPITTDLPGDLRRLIAALPRRQRQVVAARLLADLSAEETGTLLGIATGTVHVHLHRALATLRTQLANRSEPATRREPAGHSEEEQG